ncbi:MAG: DNA repair protein [Alphaproteobacteria bacterium]|nr:DNA repair protein [Alphaproteobacteria bacterium]
MAESQIRPLGHAAADACLNGGLPCGALHEVFPDAAGDAPAATGFTLALAACVARKNWLLWVQQDFTHLEWGGIFASGLSAFGLDPSRFLIVRAPNTAAVLRAGAEALSCTGLGAVVIESWAGAQIFDLVASRRLTLSAAKHGVTLFALRHAARPAPSTAETRWLVRAAALPVDHDWGCTRFDAELIRNRHGATGRWIMEWDGDGNFHQTGAAHSGAVSAAALHRPLAAETEGLRRAS